MAAASGRKSFLFFGGAERVNPRNMIAPSHDAQLEFEESDVWNNSSHDGTSFLSDQPAMMVLSSSRGLKIPTRKPITGIHNKPSSVAASLPVNIPDWSRILGEEYKGCHKRESEDEVDDDDDEDQDDDYGRLPPHEYLARTRGSSFSVHEGIGRTLKGRDLRRVRNAVWKQTGFED